MQKFLHYFWKKRQQVVFRERHQESIRKARVGWPGSPPCPWLVELSADLFYVILRRRHSKIIIIFLAWSEGWMWFDCYRPWWDSLEDCVLSTMLAIGTGQLSSLIWHQRTLTRETGNFSSVVWHQRSLTHDTSSLSFLVWHLRHLPHGTGNLGSLIGNQRSQSFGRSRIVVNNLKIRHTSLMVK
jgi:hypothetical protein